MVAPVFPLKCFSHIYVKTLKITPRSHQTYPFPCPPRSGNRRVCIIPSPFASLWSYSATVTKTVLAKWRLLAAWLLSKAKQNKTKLRIKIWSQFQCYDTAPAPPPSIERPSLRSCFISCFYHSPSQPYSPLPSAGYFFDCSVEFPESYQLCHRHVRVVTR